MKAYKGFKKYDDGTLQCRDFVYEEGETYALPEGQEPIICFTGFHACANPMDVFAYYNSSYGNVEYHEVELSGKIVTNNGKPDSKVCASKITIGRKITPDKMVEIGIEIILDNKDEYFVDGSPYVVHKDNKFNYLCKDGTLLSEKWYDSCTSFKDGVARVKIGSKWQIIDLDGNPISGEFFDFCYMFYEGFACVVRDHKYNFINTDGKILSEEWFDDAYSFNEGAAEVRINGKWATIDNEGKITKS